MTISRWSSCWSRMAIALCLLFPASAVLCRAQTRPVLMISIDGLKPGYITHAAQHGLHLPTLERFVTEGTYADGVIPDLPSVTYPDHTTLVTGVWPDAHGILNNTVFDPKGVMGNAFYWYAGDIRVPTLWEAAHAAGIHTASISWPVGVGAKGVDTLIPEFWRNSMPGANPQDHWLLEALARPLGALAEQEQRLGTYVFGIQLRNDRQRTRYALDILERQKPGFMTLHLSSLDTAEHGHGPYSPQADQTITALDGLVGQLVAAEQKLSPRAVVIVVSDHGFTKITRALNLEVPFVQAGLVHIQQIGGRTRITSWKAAPWMADGTAAIRLHDPNDAATRAQVAALLHRLASDPNNGIAGILDPAQARKLGGFPDAAFVVALKLGTMTGNALTGPLINNHPAQHGTHGFLPSFPAMQSSFFALGQGVARGRDLGVVDMRRIAPTVAAILGVKLPTAHQPVLPIAPK